MIVTTGSPWFPTAQVISGASAPWTPKWARRSVHGYLTSDGVVFSRCSHAGHVQGQDVGETPGFILKSAVAPLTVPDHAANEMARDAKAESVGLVGNIKELRFGNRLGSGTGVSYDPS